MAVKKKMSAAATKRMKLQAGAGLLDVIKNLAPAALMGCAKGAFQGVTQGNGLRLAGAGKRGKKRH